MIIEKYGTIIITVNKKNEAEMLVTGFHTNGEKGYFEPPKNAENIIDGVKQWLGMESFGEAVMESKMEKINA